MSKGYRADREALGQASRQAHEHAATVERHSRALDSATRGKVLGRGKLGQIVDKADDPRLQEFYRNAFHPELIDDIGVYRATATDGSEYARRLRASLEYLLERRPASIKQWWSLTRYGFQSEDELYAYLQELHDYFYGDRAEAPIAP